MMLQTVPLCRSERRRMGEGEMARRQHPSFAPDETCAVPPLQTDNRLLRSLTAAVADAR